MTALSTSLKKIVEGALSALPVLCMAPRLSWEASKASLRSHTLLDMQCKDTSPFPEVCCSFVSLWADTYWDSPSTTETVCGLRWLPWACFYSWNWRLSGLLTACGCVKADGVLAAQSFADLLLWLVSPAKGQHCI